MKLHIFALTTILSMGCLSGCSDMYDSIDSSPMASDQTLNAGNQTKTKHARQHFTRGEQVGLEVPFTSGEGPVNASANTNSKTRDNDATSPSKTANANNNTNTASGNTPGNTGNTDNDADKSKSKSKTTNNTNSVNTSS